MLKKHLSFNVNNVTAIFHKINFNEINLNANGHEFLHVTIFQLKRSGVSHLCEMRPCVTLNKKEKKRKHIFYIAQ